MREFKFRAYGHFGTINPKDEMHYNWQDLEYLEYVGFDGGNSFIVMQYTGINDYTSKDYQGNEIYEGDIVQYFNSYDELIKGTVEFDDGRYWIKSKKEYKELNSALVEDGKVKIIGNIYRNKKSLKILLL